MYGVKFNEIHSYTDLGLILNSKSISAPSPKTNVIDIPGADGSIDLSEALTGDVKYSNRTIKCDFTHIGFYRDFLTKWSELQNSLHGKKMDIIFDDDVNYFYVGRVKLNEWKSDKSIGKISIEIDAEPYKYDIKSSVEDWFWDSFNFETGVIKEYKDIIISGTKEVVAIGSVKKVIPSFICDSDIEVEYLGITYNLIAGSNKIYDIVLQKDENKLTFTGNGVVSIEYRGGSL